MPLEITTLEHRLLPAPRAMTRRPGSFELGPTLPVRALAPGADPRVGGALERFARRAGIELTEAAGDDERLRFEPDHQRGAEGYRLEVARGGIAIHSAGGAGAHYALATLAQLVEANETDGASGRDTRRLPAVEIDDRPDFPIRGVVIDVSRNKVPRMEQLFELVDLLASWKLNHLELYLEHTFAYPGHERVWRDWSPLRPEEVRELDAYCHERFVELTPNQNSLGHLHRWLVHEPYRRLAECPEGIEHPFGEEIEPFSLCPTDAGAPKLLAELYDTLLPCFRSRRFHVGLDETIEVGRGRSRAACDERGAGRVYLDFLRAVHDLVKARGRQMLFWADMILEQPELIPELPPDAVPVVWGYEAGHPFADQLVPLRAADLEVWVCPGTSSWMSFTGRLANARENLLGAARDGLAAGAGGYLIADWGDFGHLQPPAVSLPGLLIGSAAAWNVAAAERRLGAGDDPTREAEANEALIELLARWALPGEGRALARALSRLGDVYRATGVELMNSTLLFQVLHRLGEPLTGRRFERLGEAGLARAGRELDAAIEELERARDAEHAPELLVSELLWTIEMLRIAIELARERLRGGRDVPAARLPPAVRRRLTGRLEQAARALEPLWLARFRPGGLEASLARIERMRRALG